MKVDGRGKQQGALEITIVVNMRGEKHREEKKKTKLSEVGDQSSSSLRELAKQQQR